MTCRVIGRILGCTFITLIMVPIAVGYIHFTPLTIPKMCKTSHCIRVLKVEKCDKEKGVILFEVEESVKGQNKSMTSFKQIIRPEAEGTKPIFDQLEKGKQAIMFSIEAPGNPIAIGYVFIDHYCYTVDYNSKGKYWLLIRTEPWMSSCYYGTTKELRSIIKDILDGKEVKVPTKDPEKKEDRDKRNKEINEILIKNREPISKSREEK
jgi:hypothetical protein